MELEALWPKNITDHNAVLAYMAQKLQALYQKSPEQLKLLLYRLDIDEDKAFSTHSFEELAQIIWLRQMQKIKSRNENSAPPSHTDEELSW